MRYQRHFILEDFGKSAQQRLQTAHAAIIGLGGLGSAAALYLTAAGIGALTLIDDDVVDESNLQRQILYTEKDVARPKTIAAQEALQHRNHQLKIQTFTKRIQTQADCSLISDCDIVLDCTDNFQSRFLLNTYCYRTKKPLVLGACIAYVGQATTFDFKNPQSPCYACLYPDCPPDTDLQPDTLGVLSALPGIIGSLQATEAIKTIAGVGTILNGRLWTLDAKTLSTRIVSFHKDAYCPVCGVQQEQAFSQSV